ncbi:hypothetical protein JHK84_043139 [Glycine max]|nr:hypothetical protein JHK84_043139 [Glycine max]
MSTHASLSRERRRTKLLGRHPHCPTFISILSETARWNPQNLLSKKSRRKPYTALGTVVGAQSSKLSTLPVNKEIKTVELVKPTGWVYLSLSGADPR